MLNELFERQDALQAQADEYAPTREVFEEFLKAGQRGGVDILFGWMSPDARHSRYNCKRQAVFSTENGQTVIVEASINPNLVQYMLGLQADDLREAFIDVKVSLAENPAVGKKFELPPVSALLEQNPVFSPRDLDELGKDLEEIVPLVRALLPQS